MGRLNCASNGWRGWVPSLQRVTDQLSEFRRTAASRAGGRRSRGVAVKQTTPRVVICAPSLRREGLLRVWREAEAYAAEMQRARRGTLTPRLVVDDFCASRRDIERARPEQNPQYKRVLEYVSCYGLR